jgi:hypothetical protein
MAGYKVTFQLEYTVQAKSEQEAREIALAHASGQAMPGFQRQVGEPRSRLPPPPEWGEFTIMDVVEIGPDERRPRR